MSAMAARWRSGDGGGRGACGDVARRPYDAFHVFAYPAAALGDQPITGRALALAIPRLLPPGERADVGPNRARLDHARRGFEAGGRAALSVKASSGHERQSPIPEEESEGKAGIDAAPPFVSHRPASRAAALLRRRADTTSSARPPSRTPCNRRGSRESRDRASPRWCAPSRPACPRRRPWRA